jgi:hypothetical protein
MGVFTTTPVSILDQTQSSAGSIQLQVAQIQAQSGDVQDPSAQSLFNLTGAMGSSLQLQIDNLTATLRQPLPTPSSYSVSNPDGSLIAWIGYSSLSGTNYQGIWAKQAYFGGTGPQDANLVIRGGNFITITGGSLGTTNTGVAFDYTGGSGPDWEIEGPNMIFLVNPYANYVQFYDIPLGLQVLMNSNGLQVYSGGITNITVSPTNIEVDGLQVIEARQTGPGAPSGFADSVAEAWCLSMYNALASASGHGLVN